MTSATPVVAGPDFLWRQILDERARQSSETFAAIPGVAGLLLAGSLGRGEPWPLSDIDMILIYADDTAQTARVALEAARLNLLDWWVARAYPTSLDVGKLAFTVSEVEAALATVPEQADALLADMRWFHSMDKGYGSRATFDASGLAGRLAEWLTSARFAPSVVSGRLLAHRHQAEQHHHRARAALRAGEPTQAAKLLRESLHALMRYLMEQWGGRDNSFARFGTRFAALGAAQGAGKTVAAVMDLYGLAPDQVVARLALAPADLRRRHHLSFTARQLIGETTTAVEDARDLLLAFSTMQLRYHQPPYDPWVALDTDPNRLATALERCQDVMAQTPVVSSTATTTPSMTS